VPGFQTQIYDQDDFTKGGVPPLITFDAALSITPTADTDATDHPVEQGAAITDHLRPKPKQLAVVGFISNTPTKVSQGQQFPSDSPGPANDARSMLETRRLAGKLHAVITRQAAYENMALISISEAQTAQLGDSAQFTLSFKEIRIVQNLTITVQTALANGQPLKKQGKRVTQPAAATESDKTVLKGISDNLGLTTPGSGKP